MKKIVVTLALILSLSYAGFITAEEKTAQKPKPDDFKPSLGKQEWECIDTALHALNMTRRDTEFKKDYAADPVRFSVVQTLLSKPLEGPDYVDKIDREIYDSKNEYDKLIKICAGQMDCKIPNIPKAEFRKNNPIKFALKEINAVVPELEYKDWPDDLQEACGLLIIAMNESKRMLEKAFEKLTAEERLQILGPVANGMLMEENPEEMATDAKKIEDNSKELNALALKVDYGYLAAAMIILAKAAEEAETLLKKVDTSTIEKKMLLLDNSFEGDVLAVWDTPLGKIVIGGPGKAIYKKDAALIIDLGGDDTYLCRAGGAVGVLESPVAVLLDIAGNDKYISDRNYSQGGAVLGCSAFIDSAGNDTYSAENFSQGASLFGASLFVDGNGNDTYTAKHHTQCASAYGLSAFLEKGGDDVYTAKTDCQAFAFTKSFALLLELDGNDNYTALGVTDPATNRRITMAQGAGYGNRPFASGGIAFLIDRKGRDTYTAYLYGQGISYWFSLGVLIDSEGDDHYNAELYSQGTGIHLSVGILVDRNGNDSYLCTPAGLCQGSSHDWAVGILIDQGGNDVYATGDGGAQGTAITNGFALLIDTQGYDRYYANRLAQGDGNEDRNSASLGIFIDMGGEDFYSTNFRGPFIGLVNNDSIWRKPGWGVGLDMNSKPQPKKEDKPNDKNEKNSKNKKK